uniref:L-cysteine desulfidase family protein n=1 Tax=Enterococcus faecalis TaxID=1351 RepID=UPI00359C40A2
MENSNLFIQVLKEGVQPATGCTEPVAVAFATATAMDYLESKVISKIFVEVSANIMKNAMAVIVPGTNRPGLQVAAAAGAIVGDSSAGLKVISGVNASNLSTICSLADSGKIDIKVADVEDDLYVKVTIMSEKNTVSVWVAGNHTNVFKIEKNNKIIKNNLKPMPHAISETNTLLQQCTLREIWDFALLEPLENITFMLEARKLNMALSAEGLSKCYGLGLGRSINDAKRLKLGSEIESDLCNKLIAYTAAASDARMGGAQLPAMSNSGSGNQGITATVPVCVIAKEFECSDEKLIRALTLSHLTALYIHAFLPVLSAFCAANSAAMGAAVAICYLMGKNYEEAAYSINNMISDASGMICDGAGCSCAMKVATSVSSMYRAINLVLQGIVVPESNGLVFDCIEETIKALGKLVTNGFKETDEVILNTMLEKS